MRGIVNTLHELTERGVTVRSLHDGVDTSTSTGRMVAGILMSIAEYERELIREDRPQARARPQVGPQIGRPAKLNADQAALARRMKANGETAATICETLGKAGPPCTATWPRTAQLDQCNRIRRT